MRPFLTIRLDTPRVLTLRRLPPSYTALPGWRLSAVQSFAAPREEVFHFFADAGNLQAITPPWLHFHIVTPQPISLHTGALLDYRLRLHGVPIRWRTEISVWEPPVRFCDRQLRGPYLQWEHTHTFTEEKGGVVVQDIVDYRLPLGLFGRIAHAAMVKLQLLSIFRFRQREIARLFGVTLEQRQEPQIELSES